MRKARPSTKRRDLRDLATRIVLRLFHPHEPYPFAERLVLETKDGKQELGGWGFANALGVVLSELRARPRKRRRKAREGGK